MPTTDTVTEEALFGPDMQLALFGGPDARGNDPIASHIAADQAQHTKALIRQRVLLLVRQEVSINGRDLNRLYSDRARREGWGDYSFESPRKRAEEMLRDGVLAASNEDGEIPGGRIYSLPVTA